MLNRALIIDDSLEFRNLLSRIIVKEWPGAEVTEVDPVTEMDIGSNIDLSRYDLIFLDFDLGLPNEDGLAWLQKLINNPNAPSVIMVTAEGDELTEAQAIKLGASAYISKQGFNLPKCLQIIKDTLEFMSILRNISAPADMDQTCHDHDNDKTMLLPKEQIAEMMSTPKETLPSSGMETRIEEPAVVLDYMGYRNITYLAKGGAAEVLLAQDNNSDEMRIIKVIRTSDEEEAKMLKRFVQEYTLISQLHHPHVIQIFERAFAHGYAYIVMEYFPGGDLAQKIKQGISPDDAIEYLRQMAEGLKAVHNLNIVHRDMKCANILFREDGTLAITDFGIAKSMGSFAELTMPGEILGSPHYMSPEQIDKDEIDYRSDIYSLGIILFEMLTGQKPFKAKSLIKIFDAHLNEPAPKLPANLAGYQPLVDKMLAKSPDDRYQSAEELLVELSNLGEQSLAINA